MHMKMPRIDLSKSTPYKFLAWGSAAAGATAGTMLIGTGSIGGMAAAGIAGAVAGVVVLPAVVAGITMTGVMTAKNLTQFVKKEGKYIPLLSLMVGFTTLRAMAEPVMKAIKIFRGKTSKYAGAASSPASTDFSLPPSAFEMKIKALFEKEAKKKSARQRIRYETSVDDNDIISPGLTD